MPSNKDLKAEAMLLGEDLGIELNFTGLGNNKLAELVSDLKAKIKDRDIETQADTPPAPDDVDLGPILYKVAKGKSITCKKGMLNEDTVIIKEYIGGDQVNFDRLVEKGCIVKV